MMNTKNTGCVKTDCPAPFNASATGTKAKNNCAWDCDAGYAKNPEGKLCLVSQCPHPPNALPLGNMIGLDSSNCDWKCAPGFMKNDDTQPPNKCVETDCYKTSALRRRLRPTEMTLPEWATASGSRKDGTCEWDCDPGYMKSEDGKSCVVSDCPSPENGKATGNTAFGNCGFVCNKGYMKPFPPKLKSTGMSAK